MSEWVELKRFPGYEYSLITGEIRSLNYKRTGKAVILKPAVSTDGYMKTMLKSPLGHYKTIAVHREIMHSKQEKPGHNYEVNHINGIKVDNRPDNLEWVTHSRNCKHSFEIGIQKPKRGDLNGNSKLKKSDVEYIRKMKSENGRFWGRNEIAKKIGITAKHIQRVANDNLLWR